MASSTLTISFACCPPALTLISADPVAFGFPADINTGFDRPALQSNINFLLGRVGHADRHVSPEETQAMESLLREEGQLSAEQAMLVVSLAKTSNLLFGGTADFQVAQEFSDAATYDEKLGLARCLFAVASIDDRISMEEETEIHRIANQLRILPEDLRALRVQHRQALPGLTRSEAPK